MFTVATDTSCDIFRNELDAMGVPWVPLTYTIDGTSYPDDFTSDEQCKEFYAKIRAGAMPSTSQINTFLQTEFLERLVSEGHKEIVYLTLSKGLSATYAAACAAAKDVMDKHPDVSIYVVDTISATWVQGWLVRDAVKFRDEGMSAEEAAERLNVEATRLHAWIYVDDLNHLKRGGRVSGAAAAIGTLLKIKPILIIGKDGGLKVVHKAMGTGKALRYMAEMVEKYCTDPSHFFICTADGWDTCNAMADILREKYPEATVETGWLGPVIGAHVGPGMIGLIFKGDPNSRSV
ncbi:MAG: DegV family protein [Clostridiales bacterium]|nr:DegV family protein [Clostridiales bacterium]